MGQPIPPGDNVPLYEGLDSSWNDFVSVIPEDKRSAFAERVNGIHKEYEPLKQWEEFHKSGITPDHATTAVNLFATIENNPRQIYDAIGKHLGITPQQAEEVVEAIQEDDGSDPRIATLARQVEAMAQIMLGQRQQEVRSQAEAEADARLDKMLGDLKKKYPDVDEEEILWRMDKFDMSPEEAYQAHMSKVTGYRTSRPAPALLGQGGHVPRNVIDPTKLNAAGTKSLVAQMFEHDNAERRR